MYWRLIISLFIIILLIFSSCNIKAYERNTPRTVQIEVRGEVEKPGIYELELGSTYEDLFEICGLKKEADVSFLSLQEVLRNREILIVPKHKEEKLISINSADAEELASLPGIGIRTAEKIISYRQANGGFHRLEDLKNVKGIGEAKFRKIKEFITL